MDFLDFKLKQKRKSRQRKHSLENTKPDKRIMIEEKDSIRCTRNKLSIEKSKRTVIYDDSINVIILKP